MAAHSTTTTMTTPTTGMSNSTPRSRLDLTRGALAMNQNAVFSSIQNSMFADVNPFSIHALNRLSFPAQLFFSPPQPNTPSSSSSSSNTLKPSEPTSSRRLDSWEPLLKDKNPEPSSLDDSSCSETGDCGLNNFRNHKRPIPSDQKDIKYFERRRRNNMAAKKSRDARKNREDQLALRVAELEKENAILRAHVAFFQEEMSMLQLCILQKSNGSFIPPGKNLVNGSTPRSITNP